MKRSLLLTVGLILLAAWPSLSQQSASSSRLKEQIRKLEAIDHNPATPSGLRNTNRSSLQNQRVQLYHVLKKRVAALRRYKSTVKLSPNPLEKRVVEDSIRSLEAEIKKLKMDIERDSYWWDCEGLTKARTHAVASSRAGKKKGGQR